jgi:hypothetical protein
VQALRDLRRRHLREREVGRHRPPRPAPANRTTAGRGGGDRVSLSLPPEEIGNGELGDAPRFFFSVTDGPGWRVRACGSIGPRTGFFFS